MRIFGLMIDMRGPSPQWRAPPLDWWSWLCKKAGWASHGEPASNHRSSWSLFQSLTLGSCLDFPQWWAVIKTLQGEINPFLPGLVLARILSQKTGSQHRFLLPCLVFLRQVFSLLPQTHQSGWLAREPQRSSWQPPSTRIPGHHAWLFFKKYGS